jgi:protein disulfide-isomerase
LDDHAAKRDRCNIVFMKNKKLLMLGIAAVAALVAYARWEGAPAAAGSESQVEWLTDFNAAQAKARAENKPLLVDFTGSDWCPPCILLEKQVFSQSEFAEYAAKNVVLVKIDFPRRKPLPAAEQAKNEALARQYDIRGFPTVLVMDAAGTVKGQLGYMVAGPGRFTAKIDEILKKS